LSDPQQGNAPGLEPLGAVTAAASSVVHAGSIATTDRIAGREVNVCLVDRQRTTEELPPGQIAGSSVGRDANDAVQNRSRSSTASAAEQDEPDPTAKTSAGTAAGIAAV
jgi:hypothetical protein